MPAVRRPRLWSWGTLLLTVALACGVLLMSPPGAALAADYGPGFDDGDNGGQGRIGAYRVEGRNVYCLEPLADRPLGTTTAAGAADAAALGVREEVLAAVNWAISEHGQSSDPVVTSAVAVFVWGEVAADELGAVGRVAEDALVRVPASHRPAVEAKLAEIRAAASGVRTAAGAKAEGTLAFAADDTDWRAGTLTLRSSDGGASAVVTLTGATFTTGAGAGTQVATLTVGAAVPFRATGDSPTAPISAVGELSSSPRWLPKVASYTTPGAQLLGGGGGAAPQTLQVTAREQGPRTPPFTPTVTTAVPESTITVGAPFVDTWTPQHPSGAWPSDERGAPARITAEGTLYGPFRTKPVRAATPPADAPVAARVEALLGGGSVAPTGRPVTVSTAELSPPVVAQAPGYYVWVVSIRGGAHNPTLARDYDWSDEFGLPDEMLEVTPAPKTTTPAPVPTTTPPAVPTPTTTPTATATPTPTATASHPPVAPVTTAPASPVSTAPPEPTPGGLADTGARDAVIWVTLSLGVTAIGVCLVWLAAIKRADARDGRRRAVARY